MGSIKGGHEVLIVAAEASSALYAQRLLEYWQKSRTQVNAFGVGSDSMRSLGFETIGRSEDMAVVGIQEVLAHYKDIKLVFNRLVEETARRQPKVILLLDYPEFNLKLAKKLKPLAIPIVYYISPQVWAWRKGRIHQIHDLVDKMLVIFPFEKEFYEKHNVPVEFVGHPILDELGVDYFNMELRQQARVKLGVQENEMLLGLMPGSRRSEIKHHLKIQLATAALMKEKFPKLKISILMAPNLKASDFDFSAVKFDLIRLQEVETFKMISLQDVVLCASGTATLMVGLLKKPMVIMYRMNPLTSIIAKMFVKSDALFGMANIIAGKKVAKELFQEKAQPVELASALTPLLNSTPERAEMLREWGQLREKLGSEGATQRVARALMEYKIEPSI